MFRRGAAKSEFLSVLGVIVVLSGVAIFMTLQANSDEPKKNESKEITTPSGLKYTDLKIGTGDKAKVGSTVSVTYTGTLKNGEKFDSNVGKPPYTVTIGDGEVIRGWEEGLIGMQAGGKRKLIIPHTLGYGEKGFPPKIPPYAELIFEIEVVKVKQR